MDARSVAGVDFSTKEVHLVRRPNGSTEASWRKITMTPAMDLADRDAVIARQVGAVLLDDPEWWEGVWLCGVEYPFTNPRAMASIGLKTILGAIVASIPRHVHVMTLPGRLWQGQFCRRRGKDYDEPTMPRKSIERKPLIKARALELLESDDIWPQDAYDAFGLSWAAELLNLPALDPKPRAVRAR